MPSSPRKKASTMRKSTSVRQRSPQPLETPVGAIVTFACFWVGILLLLALISYDKNDVPSWVVGSHNSNFNQQSENLLGVIGAIVACLHYQLLGAGSYLIAVGLTWFGLARFVAKVPINQRTIGGLVLFVFAGASIAHLQSVFFQGWTQTYNIKGPGGFIGGVFGTGFSRYLGGLGALLLLAPAYLVGLVMLTGYHPAKFFGRIATMCQAAWQDWREKRLEASGEIGRLAQEEKRLKKAVKRPRRGKKAVGEEHVEEDEAEEEKEEAWELVAENAPPPEAVIEGKAKKKAKRKTAKEAAADDNEGEENASKEVTGGAEEQKEADLEEDDEATPKPKIIDGSVRRAPIKSTEEREASLPARMSFQGVKFEDYKLPPLDLLHFDEEEVNAKPTDEGFLIRNQNIIVETLGTFGLEVFPGDITRGPSITRYEIYPSKGLRVSRIATLEPDIARATKAERINIIAPIPGKDTVGIEIANKDRVPVPLRELLDDESFRDTKYKIPLALGKDVYGNPVLADLSAMPHLLVAGATGSGKSVCINSIVASLLFQFSPEQLRFIMIDPKVVEMQIYNDLPHLVVPVVTDPKKVILALRWVVKEMERRYELFAKVGKRNFDAFNSRNLDGEQKKPTRAESLRPPNQSQASSAVTTQVANPDKGADSDTPNLFENAKTKKRGQEKNEPTPESEELIGAVDESVNVGESDSGEDNPPFFVQPVNLGDDPPFDGDDPPFDGAAHDTDGDDPPFDGDIIDGIQDSDFAAPKQDWDEEPEAKELPPHEFATPEPEMPDSLPYIVVIIDELADLMQTAPADVEMAIARITQMARAAGIHLIVATQTPRAEVITGTIKANIPCRIAFQVSSSIDSRVILDAKGADRLVGKGDMLYLPPGGSQLVRSQGALISDEEIQDLVECCRNQGEPVYEQEVQETLEGNNQGDCNVSPEDEEILTKCLEVIRQERRASTSLMQRRLGLGYTRAARMMDILEDRGYVGPGEGAKPREILMDFNG